MILFNIRMVNKNDLPTLQDLYLNLHETDIAPITGEVMKIWDSILKNPDYYILIGEYIGHVVSSVTMVIIKNLTRGARPYALIENVVTAMEYRNKGYAGLLMREAVKIAKENNCYKIMLLSGSKDESTVRFYKKAGFSDTEKTGYIIRLPDIQ